MLKMFRAKAVPKWVTLLLLFSGAYLLGEYKGVVRTHPNQYDLYSKNKTLPPSFLIVDNSNLLPVKVESSDFYFQREPRYVAIADWNNDDWEDILLIHSERAIGSSQPPTNSRVYFLENFEGKYFVDITQKILTGSDLQNSRLWKSAIFVDFDNSGELDLVVGALGGRIFFFRNTQSGFVLQKSLSLPQGDHIHLLAADFDQDGYLDLYTSSYFVASRLGSSLISLRDTWTGGANIFLKNMGGSFIKREGSILGRDQMAHTWTSAAADFDRDGDQDILDANDFGDLRYLENSGDGTFVDKTQLLDRFSYSFNMGIAVADIDNDGSLEAYISNTNKFPLQSGNNKLLSRDGSKFHDQARTKGLDRCGWSWGAKWFDVDNTNSLALFVVTSPNWSSNQLARQYWISAPLSIKDSIANILDLPPFFFRYDGPTFPHPYCLFVFDKAEGKYRDISGQVFKSHMFKGARSMAEFDFNFDGLSDFITVPSRSSPQLLTVVNDSANQWVQLKLVGRRSPRQPIGAHVVMHWGDQVFHRHLYPYNGFHAQSSAILRYGVPKSAEALHFKIFWPSGSTDELELTDQHWNCLVEVTEGQSGADKHSIQSKSNELRILRCKR